MQGEEILIEVSYDQAENLMDKMDSEKVPYALITEWGLTLCNAQSTDDCKYVIEFGQGGIKNYFATIGFLQESEDGVFVRLMTDGKKHKMPNFNDIFRVKKF